MFFSPQFQIVNSKEENKEEYSTTTGIKFISYGKEVHCDKNGLGLVFHS